MEIQYFCPPENGLELLEYWLQERLRFYRDIGLSSESLHVHKIPPEECAHYSKGTYDIEFEFPFGIQELEGVAYRTDYDLNQHQKASGKPLDYFDEESKQHFIPHVVEPSAGVDRTALALICAAYDEEQVTDEKGKSETRTVLRFHPRMAPIKCEIFPLLKNNKRLFLQAHRKEEGGTPFGGTVDFDTIGENGSANQGPVTIRDRDSMKQQRIGINEIRPF